MREGIDSFQTLVQLPVFDFNLDFLFHVKRHVVWQKLSSTSQVGDDVAKDFRIPIQIHIIEIILIASLEAGAQHTIFYARQRVQANYKLVAADIQIYRIRVIIYFCYEVFLLLVLYF